MTDDSTRPMPDSFLEFMLGLVGTADSETTMTATVACGGVVVSGRIIPVGRWVQLWADELAGAGVQNAALIRERFGEMIERSADARAASEDPPMPRFFTMKDVTLFAGGSAGVELALWRGRVDDITGWSLGAYVPHS